MNPERLGGSILLLIAMNPPWKRLSCLKGENVHGRNYKKWKKKKENRKKWILINSDFTLPG
jgi:hypothetical protein